MTPTRLLTGGSDHEPLWVQYPILHRWIATLVADGVAPPGPDKVKGVGFLGETADEAERLATAYVALSESVN